MTILWADTEAVQATGGTLSGPGWQASGIAIDSRRVRPGDLFVALAGERTDGHAHAADALARGACAAVVRHRPAGCDGRPLLLVPDCLDALVDLGTAARARSAGRMAAVTGSVGKTGSKDMLGRALAAFGPAHTSLGNHNNHIGAPLSLARLPRTAEFGVFELGMNHPDEIRPLSRMVRPHLAMITTIEPVHVGFFSGEEAVARAKSEIFEGVEPGGAAVLNRDNRWFDLTRARAAAAGIDRILTFGRHPEAVVRLEAVHTDGNGSTVALRVDGSGLEYRLDARGEHWAFNSAGVLACILGLGLDVARAAAAIRPVSAGRGRGAQVRIPLADGGAVLLIDESYNASPAAMRAAFRVFADTCPGSGGRRIAVLGDMLELGAVGCRLHAELARDLLEAGPDAVYTIGSLMRRLHERLPASLAAAHADASTDIADPIAADLRDGDVVLVKGSLGTNMAPVIAAFEALSPSEGGHAGGGA